MQLLLVLAIIFLSSFNICKGQDNNFLIYYPKTQNIRLYWKDDNKELFRSFDNLKSYLKTKNQILLFATNGGMYMGDNSPLGLYINNGKTIRSINNRSSSSNFYWKPNGIFYITNTNIANIVSTDKFKSVGIKYATQSGPMLVIDGKMHKGFDPQSQSTNIRNGVGILDNGQVVFIMSKSYVTFYEFANFFIKLGCKNALFLDGAISRTYLPIQNWNDINGDFGVIIAETNN